MATKDITDVQVLRAFHDVAACGRRVHGELIWPEDLLIERTGQCAKVVLRAMERASGRGLIDYGVTLRSGWLTPEGKALLAASRPKTS